MTYRHRDRDRQVQTQTRQDRTGQDKTRQRKTRQDRTRQEIEKNNLSGLVLRKKGTIKELHDAAIFEKFVTLLPYGLG